MSGRPVTLSGYGVPLQRSRATATASIADRLRDNIVIAMREPHRRRRYAVALGMLLAWCPCAFALDPALDVSQYAHTAWKFREGFAKGEIYDIAQTSDGYLWLGTGFGLLRFDGVRNVPWQPPLDQHLPS